MSVISGVLEQYRATRNLPSTYQEVLKIMGLLYEEVLPKVELLNNTLFAGIDSPNSDVYFDIDNVLMKVLGITAVTKDKDKNLTPEEYLRDVTYEIKNADVIGVSGFRGITNDYVTLQTVHPHGVSASDTATWQVAYGNDNMDMYFRNMNPDGTWGDWVDVMDIERLLNTRPDVVDALSHRQWVDSPNQPLDQEVGDYWLMPLDIAPVVTSVGYYMQRVDNASDMALIDAEMMERIDSVDIDTGEVKDSGETDDYNVDNI